MYIYLYYMYYIYKGERGKNWCKQHMHDNEVFCIHMTCYLKLHLMMTVSE